MYWLSLVSIPLTLSTLVVAQTPYAANGFLFSNPIQLDGKVCVRAAGGVVAVNSKLEAAACASNNEQKITWSDKSIRIGGLCWSAESGSADVLLKTCNGTDTRQNWTYQKFGQRTVKTTPTGRCLTLLNSNTAPGTPVQVAGCVGGNAAQTWNLYFPLGTQPSKVARDPSQQFGTNQCGTTSSSTANCQNLWINSINDFCLFAPPTMDAVGNAEPRVVSYCMKSGRGSRTFPAGTFSGVHFVKTSSYVQLSGVGNFTKINIPNGDEGGELDPHGATAMGNPIGGIVYGNAHGSNVQYHEWSEFISYREFCIRICLGKDAAKDCPHIYDVMGCFWNQPANYDSGVFETCNGDKTLPAGIYGTSTWFQGVSPTPAGHPAAPSSQCVRQATVSVSPLEPTTGTTTSTSSTTTTTQPTGTARPIKSVKNSAKCLAASGTAAGAKLIIQDCSTSTLQSWRRYGGSGFQNVAAGTCIDVPGGRTTDGNLLQLWTCSAATNMNPNQVFTYNNNADRHITFKGVSSIDLTDGNTTNGKQMQLWSYSAGNQNQLWTY